MGHIAHPSRHFNARDIEYTEATNGCWNITSHALSHGYPVALIDGRLTKLSHFFYELYTRMDIQDGMCVCHRCDNRQCVNPDHLFLGTIADNQQDMKSKGRGTRGTRDRHAKLDEKKVKEIRRLYSKGVLQRKIGRMFGVHQANVSMIVKRKTWAWL